MVCLIILRRSRVGHPRVAIRSVVTDGGHALTRRALYDLFPYAKGKINALIKTPCSLGISQVWMMYRACRWVTIHGETPRDWS